MHSLHDVQEINV